MSINKIPQRPCPVCHCLSANVLHHQAFALADDHPLPKAFDVVQCQECTFVYADTAATESDYDTYYADYSKYADPTTSTGGGSNAFDKNRLEKMAADISEHLPHREWRIVDIGCANGGALHALQSLGYHHLLGVDPSPDCVKNTKELFDSPALLGHLSALPCEEASADLIILSHVLEHVLNLSGAISKLKAILAPEGFVYVEVPNASMYEQCLVSPFQDFNTEHINHFSVQTLENVFSTNGFAMRASGTKLMPINDRSVYPACYGIFQLLPPRAEPSPIRRDETLQASIVSYIKASSGLLKTIEQLLKPLADTPIIVWGVGQLTLKLLVETSLGRANILAFTDNNPLHHGKVLWGRPIISPDALAHHSDCAIVIGSTLHQEAIRSEIESNRGLKNKVIALV